MKVLELVLDSAIRQMVDIVKIQFGFVTARGTTDAILTICLLQEQYRAVKKPLYFCFVDLEKLLTGNWKTGLQERGLYVNMAKVHCVRCWL